VGGAFSAALQRLLEMKFLRVDMKFLANFMGLDEEGLMSFCERRSEQYVTVCGVHNWTMSTEHHRNFLEGLTLRFGQFCGGGGEQRSPVNLSWNPLVEMTAAHLFSLAYTSAIKIMTKLCPS
jgi:hypothetical protein